MAEYFLTSSDIRFFRKAVCRAGLTALRIQKTGFTASRKADSSIVTDADTTVQDMLVKKISRRFPDAAVICEENFDDSVNLMEEGRLSVIIDPVDGTAVFSTGLPCWCVSVGVYSGFRPAAGFVYSPGCGMFFHSDSEHAWLNGKIILSDQKLRPESETSIFLASENIRDMEVKVSGKIRNLGSTALHACLVAASSSTRAMVFLGEGRLWDWAGALPVLEKAGCRTGYLSGKDLDIREIAMNRYRMTEFAAACSSTVIYEETVKGNIFQRRD